MFYLICFLAIVLLIVVWPVKYAAEKFEARNTSVGYCIFAIIIAYAFTKCFSFFILNSDNHPGVLLSTPVSALAYMFILDTTYIKSLLIAVIQTLLTFVLTVVFFSVVLTIF